MDWHPTNSDVLVAGSKGGDIILWNVESASEDMFKRGVSLGCIQPPSDVNVALFDNFVVEN